MWYCTVQQSTRRSTASSTSLSDVGGNVRQFRVCGLTVRKCLERPDVAWPGLARDIFPKTRIFFQKQVTRSRTFGEHPRPRSEDNTHDRDRKEPHGMLSRRLHTRRCGKLEATRLAKSKEAKKQKRKKALDVRTERQNKTQPRSQDICTHAPLPHVKKSTR